MVGDFIGDLKKIYFDLIDNKDDSILKFKEKWEIGGSIGEVYQNLLKKGSKKEMGSVYTPREAVEFMVDKVIDNVNFEDHNMKIVDPSCGGGYFLLSILERVMDKIKSGKIGRTIESIVKDSIYGYDLDMNAVMITTIEIYSRTGVICKNIRYGDFLVEEMEKFDCIIGNPPYMGHKMLKSDYRSKLTKLYGDVFYDKGDISYCFIKKSIDSLKKGGKLLFFVSRYILEALNGKNIRNYILTMGHVKSIIDFYGMRFIKGIGIDNIIIEFVREKNDEFIKYFRLKPEAKANGEEIFTDISKKNQRYIKYITTNPKKLNERGWIFIDDVEEGIIEKIKGIALSSICSSYQGIITGLDRAFVLKDYEAKEKNIEEKLLKGWIKNKNVDKFQILGSGEVLIYSDLIDNEKNYENAIKHIGSFRSRLENRRECRTGKRKWYELQWGRDRDMFEGKKIIYPYKASKNRFAIDEGSFFSADIYAIKIIDMFKSRYSYEFLAGILNSSIYEFYIKTMAKKLGENMYEYYPNKIMTLKIPPCIKEVENEVLKGGEDLVYRVDMILVNYFGLSLYEYGIIRSWCS